MKKIILILVWSCILVSCGDKKEDSKYDPKLNSNPKNYFTVTGYVSPKLQNRINLLYQVHYTSNNKACDVTINKFEGVSSWRYRTSIYKVNKFTSDGGFTIKIPIDKFKEGYCDWRILRINETSGTKYFNTLVDFIPCGNSIECIMGNERPKKVTFKPRGVSEVYCRDGKNKNLICDDGKTVSYLGSYIERDHNYTQIEKYYYRDKR